MAVRSGAQLAVERAARVNEARFRSLIENASDIILVVAEDATIRFHTPSAERLFRRQGHEIDGVSLLDVVHPEDRPVALALVAEAIVRPGSTPAAEWRVGGGAEGWQFVEARANCGPGDPFLAGAVLTLRGIHERKVLEARLAHQAFHDPLTNLANRLLFTERLEHALQLARRMARPVTVIFVDLDDFKNVNDSLGHAAGDQLLVALSQRLLACVRGGDTAARLGGDEFAVLVEEGGGLDEALPIAERLLDAVQRPLAVAGRYVVLSASLGIASSEGEGQTADDLLRNADVAMYRAKTEGKGRVVLFEASMHAAIRERLDLEADLRGAVGRGELGLVYQPIVALASGRIVGAEALLRWNHPTRGRLHPADFLAAAASAGALPDIERWVVEEACRCAGTWPTIDETGVRPLLTVNARPASWPHRISSRRSSARAASGLSAGRLVLELTESAAVEDADHLPSFAPAALGGRSRGDRRLRDRLLVAQLPARHAGRHPEARQALRGRRGRRIGRAPADTGHPRPRADARKAGRGRADRARGAGRAHARAMAARSARGSSSRGRSRRTSCGSASRPTRPCPPEPSRLGASTPPSPRRTGSSRPRPCRPGCSRRRAASRPARTSGSRRRSARW